MILGGRFNEGEINASFLLSVDDTVIFSDDATITKEMIYELEDYCRLWNA